MINPVQTKYGTWETRLYEAIGGLPALWCAIDETSVVGIGKTQDEAVQAGIRLRDDVTAFPEVPPYIPPVDEDLDWSWLEEPGCATCGGSGEVKLDLFENGPCPDCRKEKCCGP